MHLPRLLVTHLPRLPRRPVALGTAGFLSVALLGAGSALAAPTEPSPRTAGTAPASMAGPRLTANTNAPCNAPQPKGYARCFAVVRTPANHQLTADASGPPSGALGPADIQSAYKLPSGGGQTVAIIDAGDDPNAEADLGVFRSQYGLPPCTTANGCFKKVDQTGGTSYPPDQGWGLEISLDLQAVSAACPGCNILLVEANSASINDLGTAVNEAVSLGAKFISNSYGAGEFSGEQSFDQFYNHPGVAVTVSSGDAGDVVQYPSSDPNVVSVGGTLLTKDSSVPRGWDETAWGSGTTGAEGGGSGCSKYEPQPAFQGNIPALDAACPSNRATADISADASPQSGLAVYDSFDQCSSGPCDWLQVGGTSLASPLVASMYALAGTPAANTYPVTYPYQDQNQSSDLFDITQGSNGNCGNVLCQAGPGWDGPTGLGAPDGVKALQGAPQGVVTGQVTDVSTGQPIAGVRVTASPGSYGTVTDASGSYTLNLAAGTYDLTASAYAYNPATQSGVQVTQGQTATANIALTRAPSATVSGTVTDGSGHGWPLYAKITIDGYPGGPIYTNPYTGHYSVLIASGTYTAHITPAYHSTVQPPGDGYQQLDQQLTVGTSGTQTQDFALTVDKSACSAPGYGWDGLNETFQGWSGATPRDGWTVSGTSPGWRFDNPGGRKPPAGAPYAATGTDEQFAVADASYYASHLDTTLVSPVADLSQQSSPELSFWTSYYGAPKGESAEVDVSTDGGNTWAPVWRQATGDASWPVTIPLPQAAHQAAVRVRFHYTGYHAWWWAIDSVFLGTRACVPVPGGLVAGLVTSTSGAPVDGATVTGNASPSQQGVSLSTSDPAVPAGFYWLFAPADGQQFTATATGYASSTAAVNVAADTVTRHDWSLAPSG